MTAIVRRPLGAVLLLVAIAACSGRPSRGEPPHEPRPAPDAAVESPPTAAECAALIEHVLDLGAAEREHAPPEQRPIDQDRDAMRVALRPLEAECQALSREQLRCGLGATSLDQLAACQASASSSTSNSSVAPPGIAPGAPRSP